MRKVYALAVAIVAMGGCKERQPPSACVPVLPGWATPETGKPVHLIANTVELDGRQIHWNGVAIDEQTLTSYLRQSARLEPIPFLVFDPGTSPDCPYARHIRDIIDRDYTCREGSCWHGSEAAFKEAPFVAQRGNAIP